MSGAIFFGWIIGSAIVALAANARGRSPFMWMVIAMLISPLFGLIAVLVIKPLDPKKEDLEKITIENEKKEERYTGDRDVNIGGYQLFLTKKYDIVKNSTLDKFVIGSDLFDDLASALKHADNLENISIREEFSRAYQVKSITPGSLAQIAGISAGDIIFSRSGISLNDDDDFHKASNGPWDEKSKLLVFRDGALIEFDVPYGRLGVNGEWITLNSNAIDIRLNNIFHSQ